MSAKLKQRADGRVRSKDGLGESCALCGRKAKLRECYYFKPQGRFDTSLFIPRLDDSEKYKLKSGFNSICENRTLCRRSPNVPDQRPATKTVRTLATYRECPACRGYGIIYWASLAGQPRNALCDRCDGTGDYREPKQSPNADFRHPATP